ncbi:hypothetical protein AMC87_PC00195 (plasmid) [Rhizobium phaseoli]|nr:hypothetical protein AMC87_PC00195 [Rhizobium phaseoli]KKZ84682.1 hypothetical protein RPHASCH2410_PC01820 [Rhizobium phaseoli Ch24-10]
MPCDLTELGSADEAGSDRSGCVFANGDVPGDPSAAQVLGSGHVWGRSLIRRPREQLHPGLEHGVQTAMRCRGDLADQQKCYRGAHSLPQPGAGEGIMLIDMRAKRPWSVRPISPSAWTGRPWFVVSFDCPEPFPFYIARIDDRLLWRPTPEGVRLARNFCKIRFRFVYPGGK